MYALLIFPKPGSHEALSPEEYGPVNAAYWRCATTRAAWAARVGGLQIYEAARAMTTFRRNGRSTTSRPVATLNWSPKRWKPSDLIPRLRCPAGLSSGISDRPW